MSLMPTEFPQKREPTTAEAQRLEELRAVVQRNIAGRLRSRERSDRRLETTGRATRR